MSDATDNLLTDAYAAGKLAMDAGARCKIMGLPINSEAIALRVTEGEGHSTVHVADDVQRELDKRRPHPQRRVGTRVLLDLGSFVKFVSRNKSADSAIYADSEAMSLTCVLNEEPPAPVSTDAAWRDYRAIYTCPRSPAWREWTACDGSEMTQDTFADFIEANLENLTTGVNFPAPTEVLQMARDLTVLTKGTFKRAVNPTTGASILECKSETETGSTVIPRAFLLAIPVFDGGTLYQVEARIRMAITNGRPTFRYMLHRRTEIERDAFGEVMTDAGEQTSLSVFAGKA